MMKLKSKSNYYRTVAKIVKEVGWDGRRSTLNRALKQYQVHRINLDRQEHISSCFVLPPVSLQQPVGYSPLLQRSPLAKSFHRLITSTFGLGNKSNLPGLGQSKFCVLCLNEGVTRKISETHLLFECRFLARARSELGLTRQVARDPPGTGRMESYIMRPMSPVERQNRLEVAVELRELYLKAWAVIRERWR